MAEESSVDWISGFWRRIGAFAVDTVILAVVGFGSGLSLEQQFVQLGGWGRFVGFLVALLYFGVLNSRLASGQTVGKRLMRIRVVDRNNDPISLPRSFARYSILGVPFFLNGAWFTNDALTSTWVYPISLLVFGGLLSIVYLYVFNRVTRQSLHDLAVGTYVVNAEAEKRDIGALWRPHVMVVMVVFLVSGLLPVFVSGLSQRPPFNELFAARTALVEHPAAVYAGVSFGRHFGSTTTTYLSATVILDRNIVSDAELAEQFAKILADSHSDAGQVDVIQVVLRYGYDIGIASSWSEYSYTYPPADVVSVD